MSAEEIANATNGRLSGNSKHVIDSISTDSRNISNGELFVALEGDSFDGHEFVEQALSQGAAGAVVKKGFKMTDSMRQQSLFVEVDDTLIAYQDVAAYNRLKSNAVVVAITGSSGKTTTKEMVRAILSVGKQSALISEKNFNNHVGVPMTLLKINKDHGVAVLEVGINQINEMDRLANITNPDIALVTNAGCSHLEFLKNVDTVAFEKMKIANGLKEDGTLIINYDDLRLLRHSRTKLVKSITYGFSKSADIVGSDFEDVDLNHSRLTVNRYDMPTQTIELKVNGKHNAYNALAAISVAHALNIPTDEIVTGLSAFTSKDMRNESIMLKDDILLINDAYNANPDSMEAALTLLKSLQGAKRRIAVLGDMYELGAYSERAHKEVGAKVAGLNIDHLFLYGPEMRNAAKSAGICGMDKKCIHWFDNLDLMLGDLLALIEPGDWIMIKGSRANKLEKVADKLINTIGIKR